MKLYVNVNQKKKHQQKQKKTKNEKQVVVYCYTFGFHSRQSQLNHINFAKSVSINTYLSSDFFFFLLHLSQYIC